MKKIIVILVVSIFMIFLTSCNEEKAVPMDNPQIESFHLVFEGNEYSIFKRTVIDTTKSYITIGWTVGINDDTCMVGEKQKDNYRIQFDEKYYNIVEANKMKLFTCNDLKEIGAIGEFVSDIESVLLESPEWSCDDEYCSLIETEFWNTTNIIYC